MVPGYGRDDSDKGSGINLVPGVWKPPEKVSAEWAAAARLWMQAYNVEPVPVSPRDLQRWLTALLGNLAKAGGAGRDEIDMRVKLLAAAVDDRASKHFSKDALKLAWQRFQFTPTANELMKFFDDLESDERTQAQRLMAVLDAGHKPPPPKEPAMDVDESMRRHREKQERERRELAAIVRERYGEPPPMPERQPGENDDDFLARLKEWRNGPREQVCVNKSAAAAVPS